MDQNHCSCVVLIYQHYAIRLELDKNIIIYNYKMHIHAIIIFRVLHTNPALKINCFGVMRFLIISKKVVSLLISRNEMYRSWI